MAQTSGPWGTSDNPGTPFYQADWIKLAATYAPSGVMGQPGSNALNASVAGRVVTLSAGRGHVMGQLFENTPDGGLAQVTHTPNTTGQPRIDRIVLTRNPATQTCLASIVQGAPSVTPSPPGITQIADGLWQETLYQVTVPPSSGTPVVILDDERRWVSPDGGTPRWTDLATYRTDYFFLNPGNPLQFAASSPGIVDMRGSGFAGNGAPAGFRLGTVPVAFRPETDRAIYPSLAAGTYNDNVGVPTVRMDVRANGDLWLYPALAVSPVNQGAYIAFDGLRYSL